MQGAGVGTPRAAAVSEITSGFVGAMHIPNVGMFSIGTKLFIVPAGVPVMTLLAGSTARTAGAAPNVHCI
jgi:hypothetical protein